MSSQVVVHENDTFSSKNWLQSGNYSESQYCNAADYEENLLDHILNVHSIEEL